MNSLVSFGSLHHSVRLATRAVYGWLQSLGCSLSVSSLPRSAEACARFAVEQAAWHVNFFPGARRCVVKASDAGRPSAVDGAWALDLWHCDRGRGTPGLPSLPCDAGPFGDAYHALMANASGCEEQLTRAFCARVAVQPLPLPPPPCVPEVSVSPLEVPSARIGVLVLAHARLRNLRRFLASGIADADLVLVHVDSKTPTSEVHASHLFSRLGVYFTFCQHVD